jgi:hypothetical protein
MNTLKNGRVDNGTYLGGSSPNIRVEVADRIETYDISEVTKIEFQAPPAPAPPPAAAVSTPPPVPAPAIAASDDDRRPTLRRSEGNVMRPDTTPATSASRTRAGGLELPAGTNLVIRMIEGVDSETARVGQSFAASLDEPVLLNGEQVIPRGADVTVKLVDAKDSGKLAGRAELTLDLVSVRVDGRMVDINTQTVSRESSSRGERTAKVAGGTAAVGAIIGAIAGGGKGAAIGAAAGGAAGAGTQVITKGQQVKIPSETRLTFALETAVRI